MRITTELLRALGAPGEYVSHLAIHWPSGVDINELLADGSDAPEQRHLTGWLFRMFARVPCKTVYHTGVSAQRLRLMGDVSVHGDLTVDGTMEVLGSLTVHGSISAQSLFVYGGELVCGGDVDGEFLSVDGADIRGRVKAEHVSCSGDYLHCGALEADYVVVSNALHVDGDAACHGRLAVRLGDIYINGSLTTGTLICPSGGVVARGDVRVTTGACVVGATLKCRSLSHAAEYSPMIGAMLSDTERRNALRVSGESAALTDTGGECS